MKPSDAVRDADIIELYRQTGPNLKEVPMKDIGTAISGLFNKCWISRNREDHLREIITKIINNRISSSLSCWPNADIGDTCGSKFPVTWCEEACVRRILARSLEW